MDLQSGISADNNRVLKNSVYIYLRLGVVMFIALYSTRILLHSLGVVDYGIYNVVCGFVSMFGFINISMSNGIQRFYNYTLGKEGDKQLSDVYSAAVVIQINIIAIIVLLAETIGLWYLNNVMVIPADKVTDANWIFQLSILSLVLTILQGPYSAAILAYERMDFYAIVSIIDAALKLSAAFILRYVNNSHLIAYGWFITGISFIMFVLYYTYSKRKTQNLVLNRKINKTLLREMFSFLGWNIFGSFSYVFKAQGTNLLLNSFFGTIVNAANGITTQVTYAIQSFASNLVIAFKPQLTQAYAIGDYDRTRKLLYSMSKLSYLLFCIIAIPIICEIDYILNIWIGDSVPPFTATFCILSIIATGIGCFNTPITQVIHATGQMRRYQLITSCIICSIIPISWIALMLGAEANSVFIITIAVTIINQIACVYTLNSIFCIDLKRYFTEVAKCLTFTCIALIAPYLISTTMEASFTRLVVVCLSILLSFGAIPLVLNHAEKQTLMSFIKRVVKI